MLALALLVLSPITQASGYYTSDVGVRAFSRGGAYVAGPDDLLALWYNPAALTRLGDGQVTLNVAGVGQMVQFDRADYPGEAADGGDLINDPVTNDAPWFYIPHLGVAHSLGVPNTTFAIGFYPPYAPDFSYPADGAQRYTLNETSVLQTFAGLSAATEIADWVSIGAGASWNVLKTSQELAISLWTQTETENPDYDVKFGATVEDPFAIGWNVGLLVEPPSEAWAVGAMMQAPTKFDATGTLFADFSENYYHSGDIVFIESETAEDDAIRMDISMPLILKGGALWRPTDAVEVEAAVVYEGWSVIPNITLTEVDMQVETSDLLDDVSITDDVVLPAGYKDTISVRLGGEVDLGDSWTVRAGGMFEGGAVPPKTRGVGLVDGEKFGVGLGFTWKFLKRFDLDVGGYQAYLPQTEITNSELRQTVVDPLTGDFVEGRVVGDGVMKSRIDIFGAGVNWHFGKNPRG